MLLLPEAVGTPALATLPTAACSGSKTKWMENPFSTAPPQTRRFDRLVTTKPTKGTVQQRNTLVLPLDVTLRYRVSVPPEARFETGLLGLSCGRGGPIDVVLAVETADGEPVEVWRHTVQAVGPIGKKSWVDDGVSLERWAGADVTLALSVVAPGAASPRDLRGKHPLRSGLDHQAAALLAEPVVTGRPEADDGTKDRNVVLIIVDALRGDAVKGARSFEWELPAMDRLADDGVSFVHTFSVSNQTRQSTLAMLTGETPTQGQFHSVWWTMKAWKKKPYYESDPPLVTHAAREAGWRVAHIGHNHFTFEEMPIGLDHGFAHIWDDRRHIVDAPAIVAKGIEYLKEHQGDRTFLVLNLVQPHTPYDAPTSYREAVAERFPEEGPGGLHREYLAEIAYADAELQKVLTALDELGAWRNTTVLLTADHGEVMDGRHACFSEKFQMNCHYSHGMTLYEEELHVPLVFAGAGVPRAGAVVETPVSLLDLAPTLFGLLGLPRDPRQAGLDLRGALAGDAIPTRPIYAETRAAVSLSEGGLKLILHNKLDDTWTPARTGGGGRRDVFVQLFDLTADPNEHENLYLRGDERVEAMKARLPDARRLLSTPPAAQPAELQVVVADAVATAPDRAATGRAVVGGGSPGAPGAALAPPGSAAAVGGSGTITRAVHHLALNGDGSPHALRGTISLDGGQLRCLSIESEGAGGAARCQPLADGRIEVTLAAGEQNARLTFTGAPAAGPLQLALELDGAPLSKERFYVGRYGVALAEPSLPLDAAALDRATADGTPPFVSGSDFGVFFWRGTPETIAAPQAVASRAGAPPAAAAAIDLPLGPEALDAPPGEDAAIAPEVRRVLKELGYAK